MNGLFLSKMSQRGAAVRLKVSLKHQIAKMCWTVFIPDPTDQCSVTNQWQPRGPLPTLPLILCTSSQKSVEPFHLKYLLSKGKELCWGWKVSKGYLEFSFSTQVPERRFILVLMILKKICWLKSVQKMISTILRLPTLTGSLTIIPNMNYLRFGV